MLRSLVGSEMCIRDRCLPASTGTPQGHLYAVLISQMMTQAPMAQGSLSGSCISRMHEYMEHLELADWNWLVCRSVLSESAVLIPLALRKQIVDAAVLAGAEGYTGLHDFLSRMLGLQQLEDGCMITPEHLRVLDLTFGDATLLDQALKELACAGTPVQAVATVMEVLALGRDLAELYEALILGLTEKVDGGLGSTIDESQLMSCLTCATQAPGHISVELSVRLVPCLQKFVTRLEPGTQFRISVCQVLKQWLGPAFELLCTRLMVYKAGTQVKETGWLETLTQVTRSELLHELCSQATQAPVLAAVELVILWDSNLSGPTVSHEDNIPQQVSGWRALVLNALLQQLPHGDSDQSQQVFLDSFNRLQTLVHAVPDPSLDLLLMDRLDHMDMKKLSARLGLESEHQGVKQQAYRTLLDCAGSSQVIQWDPDLIRIAVLDLVLLRSLAARPDCMHQISLQLKTWPALATDLVQGLVQLECFVAAGLVVLRSTNAPTALHSCRAALVAVRNFLLSRGELTENIEAKLFLDDT
eukprot:TRINITY_DN18799_c0_g1_i1.p1 TRINITY_DN18799_c0_g1~~TRINITY_DN18799_c0_g1_i1.p1  ORF type:complete len:576 (-),score=93.99 TRINITY_DN18799_c0_g1_i1:215-1801(-)